MNPEYPIVWRSAELGFIQYDDKTIIHIPKRIKKTFLFFQFVETLVISLPAEDTITIFSAGEEFLFK